MTSIYTLPLDSLKDAYSRMDMDSHPWARHASSEVSTLNTLIGGFSRKRILDAGCGRGRHSISICRSFPDATLTGVDFSESNIHTAEESATDLPNACFIVGDLRDFHHEDKFDIVLCLYDVVGSFPDDSDNVEIIRTLAASCRPGGYLALSVMNLEYTVSHALPENIGDFDQYPEMVSRLPSSDTMQKSGNIFDPRYYVVNPETGVVCRKEMFADGSTTEEIMIRDRRFTRSQIESMVESEGFEIIHSRFVRAGRWDECLGPTDDGSKEVLIIARRLPNGV